MLEALQVAFFAMPFVVALLLAMLLCVFVVAATGSPTVGVVLVALQCLLDILLSGLGPLQLGINVYLADITFSLLGLIALLRAVLVRKRPVILLSWYLLVLLVGVSFVLGIASFGVTAGTALRPYFYALATTSYVMTFGFDEQRLRRLLSAIAWLAVGITAIAMVRWVIVVLPIGALLPPGGDFDETGSSILRTVGAEYTALIAQVIVVGVFYAHTAGLLQAMRPIVPVLLIAVIGLQHRSVWVALAAAVGARFMLPAAGRRGVNQLIALALVLAVLAVPALFSGKLGGAAQDVARSASRAVALADTAQARFDSWKFALEKWGNGGVKAVFIGLPLGTSMDRYTVTSTQAIQRVSFQAHNYYIQTLFYFGIVGLAANLFVYGWVLRQLYRRVKDEVAGPYASALLLVLVLQLGFYITYGVHYLQGLILGLAVSYAASLRWREAAALAPVVTRGGRSGRHVAGNAAVGA